MKINLKNKILNFKGEALLNEDKSETTVGEMLSHILINNKQGGKMKMYVLANKAYTEDVLEVDDADLSLIKKSVEDTEVVSIIVSGQLLIMLDGLKKDK